MEDELKAIEKNITWELVPLLKDSQAIGMKWVFKVKRNPLGEILRHKALLVVKGYARRYGVDYSEFFTLVARVETIRVLLAIAAQLGWSVHHLDMKSAFLNRDIEEDIYVKQPEGFMKNGEENKVYKLHKALYG